jgi:uracil-DNA glycosylase
MNSDNIILPPDWKEFLLDEFTKPYMDALKVFLQSEKSNGKIIYPKSSEIFNAFNTTPLEKVKVIILGQDPYHGEGQAHGLSFSVRQGVRPPPSLQNIFKELHNDLSCPIPSHGDLTAWARQGVLLLNAVLTVRANEPASHQGKGWEQFTDEVIKKLQDTKPHLVFLLWGKFAQSKAPLIDSDKHLVLQAAHPSPFSAHNGFFGCKHFSKTNEYLTQHDLEAIKW